MKIIYNKNTGVIDKPLERFMNHEVYYQHFPQEFIDNLDYIYVDNVPSNLAHFRVKNGSLTKLSDMEIEETKYYGKVLTEAERILKQLEPSWEEIQKAEETLKLIELLEGVI